MDINLIIIIISVVALIINAVVKNNTKKGNDNDNPLKPLFETETFDEPNEQGMTFDDDQQYLINDETSTEEIPGKQEDIVMQDEKATVQHNLTEEENKTGIDDEKNNNIDTDVNEIKKIVAGFNLKSAIIYSEIINRKY